MGAEQSEKARRRAARRLVGDYHLQELARLLDRVRGGFARFDAGEIDAFGLDEFDPSLQTLGARTVEVLRPADGFGGVGDRGRARPR